MAKRDLNRKLLKVERQFLQRYVKSFRATYEVMQMKPHLTEEKAERWAEAVLELREAKLWLKKHEEAILAQETIVMSKSINVLNDIIDGKRKSVKVVKVGKGTERLVEHDPEPKEITKAIREIKEQFHDHRRMRKTEEQIRATKAQAGILEHRLKMVAPDEKPSEFQLALLNAVERIRQDYAEERKENETN